MGEELATGSGPFGLSVGNSGNTIVTANSGPGVPSYTVFERNKANRWEVRQVEVRSVDARAPAEVTEWRGVSLGVAVAANHSLYLAEGDSGRVSWFDSTDERRHVTDLNRQGYTDSFAGDLAYDPDNAVLYVADQANFRIAIIDTRSRQTLASVSVGRLPFAVALSPDRKQLYVANTGLFAYRAVPGADPAKPRQTALAFPAFGFPSAAALAGAPGTTQAGATVSVPGLGNPRDPAASSLMVLDVANPKAARVIASIPTGDPPGEEIAAGSGPAGIAAAADRVFVANSGQDSITVIDAHTNRAIGEIPLRIPGLESFRGIVPMGMAIHPGSGWLLVAEAGINAVGVVDPVNGKVLGHIPVAWFPTRVAVEGDTIFVANARGHGVGPSDWYASPKSLSIAQSQLYQGSLSMVHLPSREELARSTAVVMASNGFQSRSGDDVTARFPADIRHVVLIVKEGRSYDELMGDVASASNGSAMGASELARLGSRGYVDGRHQRLSFKDVSITPNHHAIARQWAFSDNFYADGDGAIDGHHWLAGVYPNAWFASSIAEAYGRSKEFRLSAAPGRLAFPGSAAWVEPEDLSSSGTLWDHLVRYGVSFAVFGEGPGASDPHLLANLPIPQALFTHLSHPYPGFDLAISDQARADVFLRELDQHYGGNGAELPAFLFLYLPNDFATQPRPEAGYPYGESFTADNDYALGRLVDRLSHSPWWRRMAIFVTEGSTRNSFDHIDAHRTILFCAGPWAKRNYVSHRNSSFPGLLKTIFGILHLPPLNLFDATAADLADCFTTTPDFKPYSVLDIDRRIFDAKPTQPLQK